MDVNEAIKNRRSIRTFEKKQLSNEQVEMLIDAARHAPSAGNIQPWEFVIVRNPETKKQLSVAALDQTFIERAPVVIVVCADEARSGEGYGSRGVNLYCIQDTAAATENLLLAAFALGLGTCWVGAFQEKMVKKILNVPAHVKPVAIVPVGYPIRKPAPRERRAVNDSVHQETF